MKKIFTYLTVAALMAVACEGMYGPVEAPTAPDKAGSVEIQIDTLGDEALAFTMTPAAGTSYYSFFVAAGPAQSVDSVAVYQCKLGGLASGTFKAADVPTKTIALEGLASDATYTIYAVAGSAQGIPGSVSVKEVTTTDKVTIAITAFDSANDSTVVLSFTEQVFLGQGDITATYYAINPSVEAMGVVTAESVVVDGNAATVTFAGLPHGAYYAVSYPEGAFVDSVGNPIKAFASGYNAEAGKFAGIVARRETTTFALDAAFAEEYAMFSDWQTAVFSVGVACDTTLAATGEGAVQVSYITPGKTISIDMTLDVNYAFGTNEEGKSGVMMMCPEAPEFGATVVFSFAEDAFQDMWGNSTEAAEYATLCAYDYTLEDVIGTYVFVAPDNVAQDYVQSTFEIVASDDPEAGNVMFTSFAGIPCATPIYATFTPASGNLEIYGLQPFFGYFDEEYGVQVDYVFYTYTYDYVNFSMPEAGILTSPDDYFGVVVAYDGELAAWAHLFLDFEAEKTVAEAPAPAAQSLSVVKFDKTLPLNVR